MVADDLKRILPMREVVEQYGVKVNRAGMCCCPIHGEKHPSMKIYPQSYYCFACGAHGDIFEFVQQMDKCDFKTAFMKLGGTYQKNLSYADKTRLNRSIKDTERKKEAEKRRRKRERLLNEAITDYRNYLATAEPFTAEWMRIQNDYVILLGWLEIKERKDDEVQLNGVIMRYSKFRNGRNPI